MCFARFRTIPRGKKSRIADVVFGRGGERNLQAALARPATLWSTGTDTEREGERRGERGALHPNERFRARTAIGIAAGAPGRGLATKAARKVAAKDDDDDDDDLDDDADAAAAAGRSVRVEPVVHEEEVPPAFIQDQLLVRFPRDWTRGAGR